MRQPKDVGLRHAWLFALPGEAPRMQVMCIGGACVDRSYRVQNAIVVGSSNPAQRMPPLFGGVARNVSENLGRLRIETALLTVTGSDDLGAAMLDELHAAGVNVALVKKIEGASDEYAAILERGELVFGAADMRAIESLSVGDLDSRWETIAGSGWLFVDCNVSAAVLETCAARRSIARYKLSVDAVSDPKAAKLPSRLDAIDLLFINEGEARAYLGAASAKGAEELAEALLTRGAQSVVLTLGERGAICAGRGSTTAIPPPRAERISATGAGDALVAGTLWASIAGEPLAEAVRTGAELAALTLESERSVRADLSPALLEARLPMRSA